MRQRISDTNLYVRNFGTGRSRIVMIEPEDTSTSEYDPIRIKGSSVILFSPQVALELQRFYKRVNSRPRRSDAIPGGISGRADEAMKRFLFPVTA